MVHNTRTFSSDDIILRETKLWLVDTYTWYKMLIWWQMWLHFFVCFLISVQRRQVRQDSVPQRGQEAQRHQRRFHRHHHQDRRHRGEVPRHLRLQHPGRPGRPAWPRPRHDRHQVRRGQGLSTTGGSTGGGGCKMNRKYSQDIDKVRNNDFYLKY